MPESSLQPSLQTRKNLKALQVNLLLELQHHLEKAQNLAHSSIREKKNTPTNNSQAKVVRKSHYSTKESTPSTLCHPIKIQNHPQSRQLQSLTLETKVICLIRLVWLKLLMPKVSQARRISGVISLGRTRRKLRSSGKSGVKTSLEASLGLTKNNSL